MQLQAVRMAFRNSIPDAPRERVSILKTPLPIQNKTGERIYLPSRVWRTYPLMLCCLLRFIPQFRVVAPAILGIAPVSHVPMCQPPPLSARREARAGPTS
jgi:hypothetical protein